MVPMQEWLTGRLRGLEVKRVTMWVGGGGLPGARGQSLSQLFKDTAEETVAVEMGDWLQSGD